MPRRKDFYGNFLHPIDFIKEADSGQAAIFQIPSEKYREASARIPEYIKNHSPQGSEFHQFKREMVDCTGPGLQVQGTLMKIERIS